VDLFASDGTRLSVGSSRGSALCTLDNSSSHPTGDRFKNYFESLAPGGQIAPADGEPSYYFVFR